MAKRTRYLAFSRAALAVRIAARLPLMSGTLICTGLAASSFTAASALAVGFAFVSK
jgi:hypothetical protein